MSAVVACAGKNCQLLKGIQMNRLSTASVMQRLDITSRETVRQMVKRNLLPPPMRDEGGCCNYWLESDISDYLQRLADKRDHNAKQRQQVAV